MIIKKSIILLISLSAMLLLGFFLPSSTIRYCFRNFSYYFIFILFLYWVYLFVIIFGQRIHKNFKSFLYPLTLAIVITCLIFSLAPPRFKTLTDEANLVGISKMMHDDKIVGVPVEGIYTDYGEPNYTIADAKRPIFFPFLISIIHSVKGYDPSNGFILNFFISISILMSFFWLTSQWFSIYFGYIGILMLISCPIYAFFISSSGFEALNFLFLILVFISIHQYVGRDHADQNLNFFLTTSLLLAQCRYESIIIILAVFICMVPFFIKIKVYKKFSFFVCFVPIFMLPIIWQRMLHIGKPAINKIGSDTFHILHTQFSLKYFLNNIDENLFVLMGINPNFGYIYPVSFLALIGAYFLFRKIILKQQSPISSLIVLIGFISSTSLLLIISFFFWGRFTIPVDVRLSLIFLPFIAVSAVAAIYFLKQFKFFDRPLAIILITIFVMLNFLPFGSQQSVIRFPSLPYEYEQVLEVLNANYPQKRYTLIITEFPNLYTIQNYSSFPFSSNEKISEYVYSNTQFDRILFIQKYDKISGKVLKETQLPINLNKKVIDDISLSPTIGVRISELLR